MRDADLEAAEAKRQRRVGEWLEAIHEGRGCTGLRGGVLREVRFKMPAVEDPMVLMVVKATDETGDSIAFVGAPTVSAALLAWRKRDGGAGLKWREDVPWSARRGRGA